MAVARHDTVACPAPQQWHQAVSGLLGVVGPDARVAVSISGTCPVCGRYDLTRMIVNEDNRPAMSFAPKEGR